MNALPEAHAATEPRPTCKCGESWTLEEWPELPLVGRYLAGREGWIELRSCVCGTTLALFTGETEGAARQGR